MRKNLQILSCCTVPWLLALPAVAQGTAAPKMNSSAEAHPGMMAEAHSAKASDIIGMTVKNYQDETLGTVEDLAVDVQSGRIVQVILSVGGFMGINDMMTAVPPQALHHDVANKVLHLDTNKDKLAKAPKFDKSSQENTLASAGTMDVYRHYGQEGALADNTKLNTRDQNPATMTPVDQSNSQPDINITAQIRKEILAMDDLSVNADNIKIITTGGKVTLRGPVDTAEEKRAITQIANRIAKEANVDNQLEVKAATTK